MFKAFGALEAGGIAPVGTAGAAAMTLMSMTECGGTMLCVAAIFDISNVLYFYLS